MNEKAMQSWTPARLQKLIDEKIEEGPQLDYKAARALGRNREAIEITKDVSAFANSAGGTIIYGLKEFDDVARKHLPETIDPIDGREFSREWLDQIVGQISPRIRDVRITPVRVGTEESEVCYVVEIPKGDTARQARDHRYYRRYNFESVAMADHEIRDVMNRRRHPNLEFKVRVQLMPHMTTKIMVRIWNRGTVLARDYAVRILLPTIVANNPLYKDGLVAQDVAGIKYWRLQIGNGLSSPLFPKSEMIRDVEIPIVLHSNVPKPTGDSMFCTLYADEMPGIEREILLTAVLTDWS